MGTGHCRSAKDMDVVDVLDQKHGWRATNAGGCWTDKGEKAGREREKTGVIGEVAGRGGQRGARAKEAARGAQAGNPGPGDR